MRINTAVLTNPNTSCCLTAWIRGTPGTCPFIGLDSNVIEHWLIGDGVYIDNYGGTTLGVVSDGTWRWYAKPFTTIANEFSVTIKNQLWGSCGPGAADFDAMELHMGACPAAPNMTPGVRRSARRRRRRSWRRRTGARAWAAAPPTRSAMRERGETT
ncbi:MAG: hypothetical protein JNK82_42135 [Myxococcaceae bacterium]|nr:hypothetical protein [Myxococcaceae bacterium]